MTILDNNFNGGPSGTTISTANSGQFDDNAFDAVSSSGIGTVLQFANGDAFGIGRPTGEFVMVNSGGTASTPYVQWSTSMGTQTEFWIRFYLYMPSIPSSSTNRVLFSAAHTSTTSVFVSVRQISTPRSLLITDAFGTVVAMTTALAAGSWNRIEFHAQSSGSSDLKLFAGSDVDTDTVTETLNQTGADYDATAWTKYTLGQHIVNAAAVPNAYFANWQLNNVGACGPAPFRQGLGCPAGNLSNPVAIHADIC